MGYIILCCLGYSKRLEILLSAGILRISYTEKKRCWIPGNFFSIIDMYLYVCTFSYM